MTKKKAKPTEASEAAPVVIEAFKGFDKDMKCRGMQYAVGGTYKHSGTVKACETGLHSCENPLDVFAYYAPGESRFAVVEASGKISRHDVSDSKIASAKLHVKAELSLPDFIGKCVTWMMANCTADGSNHATGYRSASSATGDSSASSATGDSSASSATGYSSASSATGYSSASSASGIAAVALNAGRYGKARASEGAAIVLCAHNEDGTLRHIRCSKVGENGIKPDVFYTLDQDGYFVEV